MCHYPNHFPNIVYTFLPQISNVRIKSFKLKSLHSIRKTAVYREVISTIVNHKSMPSHETSTCFLIFCNIWTYEKGCRWQSVIRKRYNVYLIQAAVHIRIYYLDMLNYIVQQFLTC